MSLGTGAATQDRALTSRGPGAAWFHLHTLGLAVSEGAERFTANEKITQCSRQYGMCQHMCLLYLKAHYV